MRLTVLAYLNYTLNFATLISGPIQRYQGFSPWHNATVRPALTVFDAGRAVERIVIGFFKVNVLSLVMSMMQHRAIAALSTNEAFNSRVWSGNRQLRVLSALLVLELLRVYRHCHRRGAADAVALA